MSGIVQLANTRIEVLNTNGQIAIGVTRTGDLATDASCNVMLTGSNFYFPSADGYDGIKIGCSWNAGEGGTKTAVTPIIPTSDKLCYLDVELVDFVRVAPGVGIEGNVAIHQQGITPSWIPSAPGSYYQQIVVSNSGIKIDVVPVSHGEIQEMIGANEVEDGLAGIAPRPLAGDEKRFLTGAALYQDLPVYQGATSTEDGVAGILPPPGSGNDGLFFKSDGTWAEVAGAGIASIDNITNPGGDIDFEGERGIVVTGDDEAKAVRISLPEGESDGDTLVWNVETQQYVAGVGAIASIEDVNNPGGNIDFVGETGISIVGDNNAKTITVSLPQGNNDGDGLIWDAASGQYISGMLASNGIGSIEGVTNPGGDIDLEGARGITVVGDDAANTITIGLPEAAFDGEVLRWDIATQMYVPTPLYDFTGATLDEDGKAGIVPVPFAGVPNRYLAADGNWQVEGTLFGQTGGTNGRVVRITNADNTWVDASNTDTVDQLYKAALAIKHENRYYRSGSVIRGLGGLSAGAVYYLGTNGNMTTVMPAPSATVRRVVVGVAISTEEFIFDPGEVVTGA